MADIIELARRYSGALFDSLPDATVREKTLVELRELKAAFDDVTIHEFFTSPLQTKEVQRQALQLLSSKLGLSVIAANFLDFLLERQRFDILKDVIAAYETQNDMANGLVRGTVTSVRALDSAERESLANRISSVVGKKIVLEYKVDQSLIGGIVAQVGSYKFDDSLDTQLHLLGEALKRRSH